MPELPTAADVAMAARAIERDVVRTPLIAAPALSERLGAEVLIKAELFQRGGSFKLRGVLNRVRSMTPEERERGVATVSAGNHALAVALVCQAEGVNATVFMPRAASPLKVAATRAAGAIAELDNDDAAAAFESLAAFAERTGAFVLHPFDDPAVIAGQGTVGAEVVADCPAPAAVVVPVGGGGLLSGVALAVKAQAPDARIVAVEAANMPTLTAAFEHGEPTPVPFASTLADALTPPSFGRLNFEVCKDIVDEVIALSEDELRAGLRVAYTECKLACEVGGAAAIAALVARRLPQAGPTVLVASGGNIDPALLAKLIAD